MAVDIGPKIGIDGEAEFRKALNNITQQLKTLGSEMNAVTSAFTDETKAQEKSSKTSAILSKEIAAQREKIDLLKKGLAESAAKFGENDAKTLKWKQAVADATTKLNELQGQVRETGEAVRESRLDQLKETVSKIGPVFSAAAKTVAAFGAAVAAAAAGVAAFAKESVGVGMNFDSSMSQVAATMGTTVDQIGELRDFAMEMGAKTAFSAVQAADALNYMALAGYDSEQAMSALPTVLNLAAAGAIDLAEASDMVTDVQSALGLSMEESAQLVDKMAKTASKSNTSVAQLGSAILTVGGTAKNLAGGTTELSTALGILADNGIKGAEGGTALRNIILSLSAPTKTAAMWLDKLSVKAYDDSGNLRPLNETLGDMQEALSKLSQEDQINALNKIFNKVDLKSVTALLANSGARFNELSGYIDDAAGAAQAMADTQLDNLAGDITLFKSALEGAQILISDQLTPTLREFVQFGTDALSELSMAFTENGLTGAMEKLGEILGEGLNILIEMLPEFIDAGMQLIGAVGQGLLDNLPVIISAAQEIIMQLVSGIITALPTVVSAALDIILTLANGLSESLPELLPAAVAMIMEIVTGLVDRLPDILQAALTIILALAEGLIKSLPEIIKRLPEIIVGILEFFVGEYPQIMKAGVELFKMLIENLPEILGNIGGAVASIVKTIFDGITGAFEDIKEAGTNLIKGLWEGILAAKDWLWNKITGFASGVVDGFKDVFEIHSPSRVFRDEIGKQLAAGVGVGFTDGMRTIAGQMQRSIPTPEVAFNSAAAGMVNGVSTAVAGIGSAQPVTIILQTADGQALARWLLPDLRAVSRANPEVMA